MDDHLVRDWRDRSNHDVFVQLIEHSQAKLFRTALAITGNRADAEDAWQNTVLNAYRSIGSLREPRYFQTWLTRILLNECKQALKSRAKQSGAALPEMSQLPETGADWLDVRAALSELPQEQREVIVLRFWLGMTLAEIAEVAAVPEGTAKTRLYQALKRLRVKLEEVL
ncbi:MAG: RNA polymerase sigma factor [Bacillota bacterium]